MFRKRIPLFLFSLLILAGLAACADAQAGFEPGAAENPADLAGNAVASAPVAQGNDSAVAPAAAGVVEPAGDTVAISGAQAASFDDDCAYGIGYWKKHPEQWAVQTLTVGAQSYTSAELLNILNTPPRGDASYILAQQLIAAKLNQTDDQAINEAISAADAWLATNPLDSDPAAEARQEGLILAEYLDDFNNGAYDTEACDRAADEDDDEDEVDDEEDQELADTCTGADPHPHATTLAANYGVSYEEIMDWFCQGYGFGEIELAYLLSEEVGLTAEEVFALRAEGMGWGNIRKELGAAPGLGNDKPGRGNDRDNNAPPGLEKKDDDWSPPGQEKKNNGANGSHVPPGQAKQPADSRGNGNGHGKAND